MSQSSSSKLIPIPTNEESHILPTSVYAINKLNQEQLILLVAKNLNINTTVLRFQNVFGPGQSLSNPYTGILSIFSTIILNNNNIDVYEDGLQSRDFIYIDDVVEASYLALTDNDSGEVFNVGTGMTRKCFRGCRKIKVIIQFRY